MRQDPHFPGPPSLHVRTFQAQNRTLQALRAQHLRQLASFSLFLRRSTLRLGLGPKDWTPEDRPEQNISRFAPTRIRYSIALVSTAAPVQTARSLRDGTERDASRGVFAHRSTRVRVARRECKASAAETIIRPARPRACLPASPRRAQSFGARFRSRVLETMAARRRRAPRRGGRARSRRDGLKRRGECGCFCRADLGSGLPHYRERPPSVETPKSGGVAENLFSVSLLLPKSHEGYGTY